MTTRCSVCGRSTRIENLVTYGRERICRRCKPEYFQGIREGASASRFRAGYQTTRSTWPTLATVMFVLDIVFCSLGILLLVLSAIFWQQMLTAIPSGHGDTGGC